ncbi:hypothetical protein ACSG7X_000367 [Vibrio fluvialis]
MKFHDKLLVCLSVFSFVFVVIFDVFAKDSPEWFVGASELVTILVNIFLSCLAGCIIYFISCYLPLKEVERKQQDEQAKADEMIATHLKRILDQVSRIFIVSYGDMNKFEDIVLHPFDEDEFKAATKSVSPRDQAVISRTKYNEAAGESYLMTVEEFIFEAIDEILGESQKLFQLERFLSVDLIKAISSADKAQIINNWDTLMDDKSMVLGDGKYHCPKGNLASYSSHFKSLDIYYRRLQSELLTLKHTEVGCEYSKAFE